MQEMTETSSPDPNQISLGAELGIELAEAASSEIAVSKIDEALAEKSLEEQARWFALSVYRHLTSGQWSEPAASELELSQQYSLARACLAVNGFSKSMTTVLKDRHCLFTLLTFGKVKDKKRNLMSSTTRAFKIAVEIINEGSLLPGHESQEQHETAETETETETEVELPESKSRDNTAANRRAGRRGYLSAELNAAPASHNSQEISVRKHQASSMSEKEFLDLEEAIENSTQQVEQQEWSYRSKEDRWSLILGLAAGVGFFSLVLILFL